MAGKGPIWVVIFVVPHRGVGLFDSSADAVALKCVYGWQRSVVQLQSSSCSGLCGGVLRASGTARTVTSGDLHARGKRYPATLQWAITLALQHMFIELSSTHYTQQVHKILDALD